MTVRRVRKPTSRRATPSGEPAPRANGTPGRPLETSETSLEPQLGRAERLGHDVVRLRHPPTPEAPPVTGTPASGRVQRRVFLNWGSSSTEADAATLVEWLARGGVTMGKEDVKPLIESDDTYSFPWQTGQGRLVRTLRALVPSSAGDEARVGLEVEMGWVQIKAPKDVLVNTAILAVSEDVRGKGIPRLRLEVEGMVKGTPYVEAVFGPLPTRVISADWFVKLRQELADSLSRTAALERLVRTFNKLIKPHPLKKKFLLTVEPGAGDYPIKTTKAPGKGSPSPQTNVALPYSKLGQSASREGGDFAELFERPGDRELFTHARSAAQGLTLKIPTQDPDGDPGERRHMASFLTHYLFQEAVFRRQHLSEPSARRREDAKHHFHVFVKASLDDVVFSILSDGEAEDLAAWAEETDVAAVFQKCLQRLLPRLAGAAIDEETIRSVFYTTLPARAEQGRRRLPKVGKGEEEWPVELDRGREILHSHPRASARIPVVEKDGEYYVVVEQRSKGSSLNKPEVSESSKVEFLTRLQTPSTAEPEPGGGSSSRRATSSRAESSSSSSRSARVVKVEKPRGRKPVTKERASVKTPSSFEKKSPTVRAGSTTTSETSTVRTFSAGLLRSSLGSRAFGRLKPEATFRFAANAYQVVEVTDKEVRAVQL